MGAVETLTTPLFPGSSNDPFASMAPGAEDDPFFGGAAAHASQEASAQQVAQADRALAAQVKASELIRSDLAPFREGGAEALPILRGAIDDPSSRVLNNPFFQSLAADQEQRLLASQAARGKAGSGETGDELTRNLLLLGNQFAQQDIGNLFNLSTIGANAAAQTGTQTQQGASAIGGILGNIGSAQAAGTIGAANAQQQGGQNALAIGSALLSAFCDIRLKEDIRFSHFEDGIRIYNWSWTEEALDIVGDQETQGPIAQSLKKTHPEKVFTDPETGYYKVIM